MAGAKTRLSKAKIKKAVAGTGGILSQIAKKCDVSRKTLYNFLEKHPEIKQIIKQEEELVLDIAEGELFKQVKLSDLTAIKYLLSTKGKNRGYTTKQEHEIQTTKTIRELLDETEK